MATNRSVVYIKTGEVQVQPIDFPKLVDASNGRKIEHGVILKIISTNICGDGPIPMFNLAVMRMAMLMVRNV